MRETVVKAGDGNIGLGRNLKEANKKHDKDKVGTNIAEQSGMNALVKAVLKFYPKICGKVTETDRLVKTAAMKSFGAPHMNAAECLLRLSEKKIRLINLKCIIDAAVSILSPQKKEIAQTYTDGKRIKSLLDKGISERTLFRRVERALISIALTWKQTGFDEEFFAKEYGGFSFMEKYLRECERGH